uniref:Uncharacterized protein n=1 Tax=Arundo donax TaxID=35708 RepID=A0A0A9CPR4_ARUDO
MKLALEGLDSIVTELQEKHCFSTRSAVVSLEKLMVGRIGIEGDYRREARHLNEFLKCILIKILRIGK